MSSPKAWVSLLLTVSSLFFLLSASPTHNPADKTSRSSISKRELQAPFDPDKPPGYHYTPTGKSVAGPPLGIFTVLIIWMNAAWLATDTSVLRAKSEKAFSFEYPPRKVALSLAVDDELKVQAAGYIAYYTMRRILDLESGASNLWVLKGYWVNFPLIIATTIPIEGVLQPTTDPSQGLISWFDNAAADVTTNGTVNANPRPAHVVSTLQFTQMALDPKTLSVLLLVAARKLIFPNRAGARVDRPIGHKWITDKARSGAALTVTLLDDTYAQPVTLEKKPITWWCIAVAMNAATIDLAEAANRRTFESMVYYQTREGPFLSIKVDYSPGNYGNLTGSEEMDEKVYDRLGIHEVEPEGITLMNRTNTTAANNESLYAGGECASGINPRNGGSLICANATPGGALPGTS